MIATDDDGDLRQASRYETGYGYITASGARFYYAGRPECKHDGQGDSGRVVGKRVVAGEHRRCERGEERG